MSLIAFAVYWDAQAPADAVPKGDTAETVAWVALGTSIITLLTAIVGLIEKIISLRQSKGD